MKTFAGLCILENLAEIVNPEHTALVLWDCQNALVNSIFNREEYLANLKALLTAARRRKVPVVYTKITPLPAGYQSAWGIYQSMKRFNVDDPSKIPAILKPGSPEAEINATLAPIDAEVAINKHTANIFFGTNFEQLMRFRGIQSILFTGIATEYGIEHSAREAAIRGFYTVIVSDCVSSSDKTAHEMALKIMSRICLVATSRDIVKEWSPELMEDTQQR
jgi:nicotinamidase-related amidase